MQGTIALLLRHLLSFTPERIQQLPVPNKPWPQIFCGWRPGLAGTWLFGSPGVPASPSP